MKQARYDGESIRGDIFPPEGAHSLKWGLVAVLAVIISAFACFGPTLRYPFVFDDHHSIRDNRHIREDLRWANLFTDPQTFSSLPGRRMYRPFAAVSYALNYKLSGYGRNDRLKATSLSPGWRITNIIFHIINGLLVFFMLELLTRDRHIPLLLSLLFVVHPVVVEPVVYLSARSTLMGATFLFGAFYCYMRFRRRGGAVWAAGAPALFLMGLLCKENVFMLPIILIAVEAAMGRGANHFIKKGGYKLHAPLWLIAVFYLLFRKFALRLSTMVTARPDRPYISHLLTQVGVWLGYLGKALWPAGLTGQSEMNAVAGLCENGAGVLSQPAVWLVAWVALGFWLYRLRSNRRLVMGVAFAALILLPETVVAMNQLSNDRRVYMPLLGLLMGVAAIMDSESLLKGFRKKWVIGALSIIVLLLSAVSVNRARQWRDEKTLWFSSIRRAPDSPISWRGLASVYEGAGNFDKSLWALNKVLSKYPNHASSLLLKGAVLLKLNKPRNAMDVLKRALDMEKSSYDGWYNYGLALSMLKRFPEAENAYEQSIEIRPDYPPPHNNMGTIYMIYGDETAGRGEIKEAARYYEKAAAELILSLGLDPTDIVIRKRLEAIEDKMRKLKETP